MVTRTLAPVLRIVRVINLTESVTTIISAMHFTQVNEIRWKRNSLRKVTSMATTLYIAACWVGGWTFGEFVAALAWYCWCQFRNH